jgi:hypothetical protein
MPIAATTPTPALCHIARRCLGLWTTPQVEIASIFFWIKPNHNQLILSPFKSNREIIDGSFKMEIESALESLRITPHLSPIKAFLDEPPLSKELAATFFTKPPPSMTYFRHLLRPAA